MELCTLDNWGNVNFSYYLIINCFCQTTNNIKLYQKYINIIQLKTILFLSVCIGKLMNYAYKKNVQFFTREHG